MQLAVRITRRVIARLALVILLAPFALGAQGSPTIPADPQVVTGTLANGLRYYIRQNSRPEGRAELRLAVNVGSLMEDADQRGLAHFLEHMAFNGTANFSGSAIVDFLEASGMRFGPDVNAYTGFDETVYMLQLPTDSARIFTTGFRILREWAGSIALDSTEIEKERGVVIEEWRLGRGSDARMRDKQLPILFHGSRYAERLPIGDLQTLTNFPHPVLARFYRDWYRPELMAVIAVGDFDVKQVEQLIRDNFTDLAGTPNPRAREGSVVATHDSTLVSIATDPEATRTVVNVYFIRDQQPVGTVAAYRRELMEGLYDGMLNERLQEITTKPEAPFVAAFASHSQFVRGMNAYSLGALVAEGGVERGLTAVLIEAERVARFGFTGSELDRSKQNLLRSMESAYEERERTNSAAHAGRYVDAFLEGRPFPGIEQELELVRALLPTITLSELNALARASTAPRGRAVLVTAPPPAQGAVVADERALRAAFDAAKSAEVAAYTETVTDAPLVPVPPAPGRITAERTIPGIDVTEWTLSNGARVVLKVTDFKADEIIFSASSPGGSSLASDARALNAENATLALMVGGVGEFDQIELPKKLAGKQVGVIPTIGTLEHGFSGMASPRDVETLFQLVYLYTTAPRRDSVAFEAVRAQYRGAMANMNADPMKAFRDTVQRVLTQYHPRVRLLTPTIIDSLSVDESLDFYRARFADASGFTYFFVGNLDTAAMRPLVETYLASLPSTGRKESWRDVGIRPPSGVVKREVFRGLEPKSETTIHFTGDFDYTRENRFAISSLADLLSIKLRESLREALGGTYGVRVSASPVRDPVPRYSFEVAFSSAPERAEELTRAIFAEIELVKQNGASAADIEKVKEGLRRGHEANLRTNGYWMGQLAGHWRLGTDPQAILTFDTVIETLSSSMLQEAARQWLREDNYVQVRLMPQAGVPEQ
jgi:zinc protease